MTHNFLARTHHIRSLRKLAILGSAAERHKVFVLFKYGKPGIFYCEGSKSGVEDWAKALKQSNYMGYTLGSPPNAIVTDPGTSEREVGSEQSDWRMERTDTTAQFAKHMEARSILDWWRAKMGFTGEMKGDGING
jgi:hypothetical protein